jgi:hypothetical protein
MRDLFMRFRFFVAPLFLAILFGAGAASATTVIKITLPEMVKGSHTIVLARVVSARAVSIGTSGRNIQTHVRLNVLEVLKGDKNTKNLTLELAGGRLGKWAIQVPGMPTFTRGREILLFLEKTASNWALTGLGQGKFSIYLGAKNQKLVRRNLSGMHFVGFDKKGRFQHMAQPVDKSTWLLSEILEQIKALVLAHPGTK